ncbi:MAG: hypothetical protein ABIF71_15150, partial [Planctomycetota bacterium]
MAAAADVNTNPRPEPSIGEILSGISESVGNADFLIRAENGLAHFHVRQECKSSAFRSRDGGKIIRSVRVARRQLP